ncbi:citryl-CoA lyase [Devosia sp. A449]
MSSSADSQNIDAASAWWRTSIIEIQPGVINLRGQPVQSLIGKVSFTAMIWLMTRAGMPTPTQERLLEGALVASVDHGPHAPSIAIARMSATCGVGVNNAMASAINALGDVHGGAGQQCLALYSQIADAPDVEAAAQALVADHVDQRKHIPGFGHRFHPIDPRAEPLMSLVREATSAGEGGGKYLRAGLAIEEALKSAKGRRVPMNIDGATAVIFGELGFSAEEARGLFILSRSVGILAHTVEQMQQGQRIKGPMPPTIPYLFAGPDGDKKVGAADD